MTRITGSESLIDCLDRVIDKGVVIDAWMRVSLVGIERVTVDVPPDPGGSDLPPASGAARIWTPVRTEAVSR